jgi:hypothetical protein
VALRNLALRDLILPYKVHSTRLYIFCTPSRGIKLYRQVEWNNGK